MQKIIGWVVGCVAANAFAANSPQLYCLSTHAYGAITQIALFTNDKGTLRVGGEITSQEGDLAPLGNLMTFTHLQWNESTGTYAPSANSSQKNQLELVIDKEALSAADGVKLLQNSHWTDEEDGSSHLVSAGSGFAVEFKKFHRATLKQFKIAAAPKDSWHEALNQAFTSGNTEYVCGDHDDVAKAGDDDADADAGAAVRHKNKKN